MAEQLMTLKLRKLRPKPHPFRIAKLTSNRHRTKRNQAKAPAFAPKVPATEPTTMPKPQFHAAESPAEPRAGMTQVPALQLYLREIGQVKLLTPKEEIALAKRIKRGDEQAREHMIKANLRLVVKIARDYDGLGLPLLDLINEGNIGLMKGVERFNPAKGAKLSTYASWWIKQSIKRALANQSKTIRLPVHVVDTVAHIRRAEMRLHDDLDRDPTDEEIAAELKITPRRVREYRDAARAPVSLEAPLGPDGDSDQVSEIVADTSAAAPFDDLIRQSDTALLWEVLDSLSPRERAIVALRFGLEGDNPKTLEEIGAQFGVTRERIRQIQNEALRKLRVKVEKKERPLLQGIKALVE